SLDCRQDGSALGTGDRGTWLFNSTIAGIEQADAIPLIGANPRLEAAVLNARIRKVWRATGLPIGVIGEAADLYYDYRHLGAGPDSLKELVAGRNDFADVLAKAERPLVIVGPGALARADGAGVLALAAELARATGVLPS